MNKTSDLTEMGQEFGQSGNLVGQHTLEAQKAWA